MSIDISTAASGGCLARVCVALPVYYFYLFISTK